MTSGCTMRVMLTLISAVLGSSYIAAQSRASSEDKSGLARARSEWQAGKLHEARSNLELILKRRPHDPQAILLMGMVEEKSGNFAAAAKLLTAVPQALKTEPFAAAALTTACYHTGTVEQARVCMEPARSASPQGIFLAATAAADAEDFETAEAMFLSITESYPDPAALQYQLALVQYHEGHLAESQATLTAMVASGHGNGDVHNLLGWCWFKSNNMDQAEQELQQAIQLDPSAVTNFLDLTRMQLGARQLDAALASAGRTVKLFPALPEGWLLKGSIETAGQRLTDAEASYATAVRLSRNDPEAELALASAQWLAGMTARSRASFQRLLQRYPRNAAICATYADFLTSVDARDAQQATSLMKRAVLLDPALAEPHYYLGNLALTEGRLDEAVQQLEAATHLDPDNSKGHFALSRALRQQGHAEESARELEQYKTLKAAEDEASGSMPAH